MLELLPKTHLMRFFGNFQCLGGDKTLNFDLGRTSPVRKFQSLSVSHEKILGFCAIFLVMNGCFCYGSAAADPKRIGSEPHMNYALQWRIHGMWAQTQ